MFCPFFFSFLFLGGASLEHPLTLLLLVFFLLWGGGRVVGWTLRVYLITRIPKTHGCKTLPYASMARRGGLEGVPYFETNPDGFGDAGLHRGFPLLV